MPDVEQQSEPKTGLGAAWTRSIPVILKTIFEFAKESLRFKEVVKTILVFATIALCISFLSQVLIGMMCILSDSNARMILQTTWLSSAGVFGSLLLMFVVLLLSGSRKERMDEVDRKIGRHIHTARILLASARARLREARYGDNRIRGIHLHLLRSVDEQLEQAERIRDE